MITSANAGRAGAYGSHRLKCYDEVERYSETREKQAMLEVGDSDARFRAVEKLFTDGCGEFRSLEKYLDKTTKVDGSLVAAHNETRNVLMESSFGYAVVFGSRFKQQLSPLSELLLATHQLDWRLGERCLALSRISEDLRDACREAYSNYTDVGGTSIKATTSLRSKLAKAETDVHDKRAKFKLCRPASTSGKKRDDLWFAENELRVASRR